MTMMFGRSSPAFKRFGIGALAKAAVAANEHRNERLEPKTTSMFENRDFSDQPKPLDLKREEIYTPDITSGSAHTVLTLFRNRCRLLKT